MPPPSFNLKQRLAALSLAQSAPSSPYNPNAVPTRNGHGHETYRSPSSPMAKAKAMFNSPTWKKRSAEESSYANGDSERYMGDEEKRMVQEVLSKMIFQAGVDFETRPMVVLNASALPDPQVVSYDLLLARILSYLNLYVEADYTVVFFAAGSKHAPSWNWVWKAYRSLSRKYRKNLKQLYIVHSSFFSKMLFSLAGAIISPKFFRKLVYVPTLSELAKRVPLTQIDVPPAVYQENLKFERKITLPIPTRSNVFGVPLEDIMGFNGEKGGIPRVVKDAIQFLRDMGLQEEGLFRRSPSSALLRAAQEAYDRGNVVSLNNFGDPHLAAVLLKKYLRDLPEPIFPESTYGVVRRCPLVGDGGDEQGELASVQFVREVLLPELVPCAYILLSHVLHLLHDVSLRSATNRMDATNLAIVTCPNLVRGASPMRDVMMCSVPFYGPSTISRPTASAAGLAQTFPEAQADGAEKRATLGMIIALCIRRYYEIFDEVVDRSEAVAPWRALGAQGAPGTTDGTYVLDDGEEDESLNDEALVMPIGGEHTAQAKAWGPNSSSGTNHQHTTTVKRHRATLSNASNASGRAGPSAQSLFADTSNASSPAPSAWNGTVRTTTPKARSVISVESSGNKTAGGHSKRGSIALGRGTTRKGSGAGVAAISVVAEGFFTPPSSAPAVPRRGSVSAAAARQTNDRPSSSHAQQQDEEAPRPSVGERRRMFEGGT